MNRRLQRLLARFLIFLLLGFWPSSFFAQTAPNRGASGGIPSGIGSALINQERNISKTESVTFASGGGTPEVPQGTQNQVHVLGQVKAPGTYRVGSSVRAAEVVALAGGLTERGSMRNVEIRRSDLTLDKIDLFRFYEQGDLNVNPFLQDNDVIFVPFQTKSVRIEGPVKKSGIYELTGETNVWDAVQLAGGFTVGASEQGEIVVVRYENENKTMIKIPNVTEELKRTPLQNGDIVVIPHIFTKDKKFDYAFPNLPMDDVFYPSYNDQIYVAGSVIKPGSYQYQGHLSILDYINMAGPDPKGNIKGIKILRPDGSEVKRVKKYTLNPGDTIVVPERKLTGSKTLTWYNTFASSLFTFVSLRSLIRDFN